MRDAVIFDLDGTLVDTSAVEHLAQDDFFAFQAAAIGCPPNVGIVAEARAQANRGRAVLVVTSREFIWRDATLDWLVAHDVPHEALYMRVASDYRPAVTIKSEILRQIEQDGFAVVEAWEDAADVRDLYASVGAVTHAV